MFSPSEEIIEAFITYIRKACEGEINKDSWKSFIEKVMALEDLITEGDDRYFVPIDDSIPLFLMIENNAIDVKMEDFSDKKNQEITNSKKLSESSWNHIQTKGKTLMTKILEERGYHIIDYELVDIPGLRSDVSAKHLTKNTIIIGECGPCKLDKILRTLKRDNYELWHLTKSKILYIYKRGTTWLKFYKILENIGVKKNIRFLEKMEEIDSKSLGPKLNEKNKMDKKDKLDKLKEAIRLIGEVLECDYDKYELLQYVIDDIGVVEDHIENEPGE